MTPIPVVGRSVVGGAASGPVVSLREPLSFWGGFDPETGVVIDQRHPDRGRRLAESIVLVERGRGSSSGSSVLAEAIRVGTAPAAMVMCHDDEIIALGAIAAEELYGRTMPVVIASPVSG